MPSRRLVIVVTPGSRLRAQVCSFFMLYGGRCFQKISKDSVRVWGGADGGNPPDGTPFFTRQRPSFRLRPPSSSPLLWSLFIRRPPSSSDGPFPALLPPSVTFFLHHLSSGWRRTPEPGRTMGYGSHPSHSPVTSTALLTHHQASATSSPSANERGHHLSPAGTIIRGGATPVTPVIQLG